jgi:hypothetical protein
MRAFYTPTVRNMSCQASPNFDVGRRLTRFGLRKELPAIPRFKRRIVHNPSYLRLR